MEKNNTPLVTISDRPVEKSLGGGLEGAERTTREMLRWTPPIISPDRQINQVKEMADARSLNIVQNDGYLSGAINIHRDSIVGTQFRVNAQPDATVLGAPEGWVEEFQEIVEARFNLIADSPECWLDASRQNTLTGLIRLIVGGFVITGEALGTSEWLRASDRPCRTALQLVSPNRLSNPNGMSDTRYMRRGVERDFFGAPVAYHFRNNFASDLYMDQEAMTWRRVESAKPWGRRQVLHIIDPLQPDQTRGISDMVSALKQMKMTKQFQDITLQNAVVNATYAAAIESELPREMIFGAMGVGQAGMQDMLSGYMTALQSYIGAAGNIAVDGVKIPHLFPGTKLNMMPMGTPGGVGSDFEQSLLRHTSASLGLSYEEFSRDFTKTNYSSARASMGQTWKYMQGRKKSVADRSASFVYNLVLEEEINAGNVPLPPGMTIADYYKDPVRREALHACDWIGASRGQIDEKKETEAALLRIDGGLSTWEEECARLGKDWRKVFKQQARERTMQKTLDIKFASSVVEAAPVDPNVDGADSAEGADA